MSEANKDQVAELSAQLSALENESQRLLSALQWSSTVRNILLLCLVAFCVVFGYLYYSLYREVNEQKIAQIQAILVEKQDEILKPVTDEAYALVQDVGPEVVEIFQKRIESDGKKYVNAFTKERDILSKNLELHVEEAANQTYEKLLADHEKILQEEFPDLDNEANRARLHTNMAETYKEVVRRYYIDYFKKEIEKMAVAVDQFPVAEPDEAKGPLAQQVLYELMEMVQMMMVGPSDDLNLAAAREAFANPPSGSTSEPANASQTPDGGGQ